MMELVNLFDLMNSGIVDIHVCVHLCSWHSSLRNSKVGKQKAVPRRQLGGEECSVLMHEDLGFHVKSIHVKRQV